MTDNGHEFTGLNYELLVEDSLRLVVRAALRITEQTGLPGETHFYISFLTGFPGVEMEDGLRAQHPDSITIVIQHQYADLVVEDDKFSITLFFGGKPSAMTVPFAAVTSFNDPSVGFGLQFGAGDDEPGEDDDQHDGDPAMEDLQPSDAPSESAEVVSLDSFRKTPS
ncbi:MAG: ClpXP protease specificity-enhancing factor SspB [Pseudomonadota bacterium]|nr:ClpXP protease specificity-enhancing factor SspB [Pseudomonadota bacterium]MEC7237869.1 ClpXP protease specificity-enhancing factor SspB [Pseudomonadota bacterium]